MGDTRRIVVIGGSAGSLEPILQLFGGLPSDIDASYFVVQHIHADAPQYLPELIAKKGVLPARQARDQEPIESGRVYVAPPDQHLLIRDGTVELSRGPRENRTRPAIDPLFRSAAVEHRSNVIGVLLSGMLDDGASGMVAIKRCGGTTIVQDPHDAAFGDMPASALAALQVDHCVSSEKIAPLIADLARLRVAEPPEAHAICASRSTSCGAPMARPSVPMFSASGRRRAARSAGDPSGRSRIITSPVIAAPSGTHSRRARSWASRKRWSSALSGPR